MNWMDTGGTQIVTVMISVPIMSCRQIISLSEIVIISRSGLNLHPMSAFWTICSEFHQAKSDADRQMSVYGGKINNINNTNKIAVDIYFTVC